ncbi:cyclic peptide export ABC transporter [Nostoc sp. UCD121]|uniref:cyclic peptide export ABC transporter n=1 Tax=unclassified Nostoc TaxID=2593658 RepID=UPI0016292783|nr:MULTISPECIES: cyclic peptide export ABC transporter [unclassified Nostoc]MBC1224094.1 cyclic peptide export ABC transporter [Nostoc sp. UCD120]MBC1274620.1 cyclic peptide export ABC transporter [Nostoc sp. UCD121]MBC1298591.1 cyclic peptide export ABC transporter [Nostoc sp. UCD122]
MNLIRLLLRTSSLHLCLAILAGILSGGTAAGLIALINMTLSQNQPSKTILIWSFVSLCSLRLIANFISQFLLIQLSQKAILNLRIFLTRSILASPLRHLEQIGAHGLLAVLTEDIQTISNTVITVPFVCINIAIVIACLIYLSWLSKIVFLIGISFMFLGIFSYSLPMMKAMSFLKLAREQEDRLFKHFRSVIQGTKELKLHRRRRQAFLSEELHTTALSFRRHNVVGMSIFAAAASWGQVLFFVAIGLLLFIIPTINKIPPAILSAYALTIIYLISPLEYIMSMMPSITKALVALKKVESLGLSLVNYSNEICDNVSLASDQYWNCLELVNITHAYYQEREESNFILGPINLKFHPGELVFIVGGNGSGKSTLAKLISGLYIPETGNIYLDDQLIDNHNLEWYRQQFSVVFSDFYLFDRFLGLDSGDLDIQTQKYLIQLQLDHKVKVNNGVLSTTDLSQGQRKRLALVTAYLEDRPIYMFDEWASDQDPVFKEIFYTQLLVELKKRGKTVLVISHDDQYFYLADRIVKLEYGQVKTEHLNIGKEPNNVFE